MDNSRNRRDESPEDRTPAQRRPLSPYRPSGRARGSCQPRHGDRRGSGDVVLHLQPTRGSSPPPSYEEAVAQAPATPNQDTDPARSDPSRPTGLSTAETRRRVNEQQNRIQRGLESFNRVDPERDELVNGARRAALVRRELERFYPQSFRFLPDHSLDTGCRPLEPRRPITPPASPPSPPARRAASPPTPPPAHRSAPPPTSPPTRRVASPPSSTPDRGPRTFRSAIASRVDRLTRQFEELEARLREQEDAQETSEEEAAGATGGDQESFDSQTSDLQRTEVALPFGIGVARVREQHRRLHIDRISRLFFSTIISVKEQTPRANADQLWLAFVSKLKDAVNYGSEDEVRNSWFFVFNKEPRTLFAHFVTGSVPEVYWKVYSYQIRD